jgi:hypothetical protein
MTDLNDDDFAVRVSTLIAAATANLDPQDRAERIAWCRENNAHGVRMFTDPDGVIELRWGNRRLAMVRASDLETGVPLRAEFVGDVPDAVPDEWA